MKPIKLHVMATTKGMTEQDEGRLKTQTTLLLRQLQRSPLIVLAVVGAVTWVLCQKTDHARTLTWFGIVFIVLSMRFAYAMRVPKPETDQQARQIMRYLVFFAFLNGLAVGLATPLIFFDLQDTSRALIAMVLVGLSAGGIATSAGYPPVFTAYMLPALLPLAWGWAQDGDPQHILTSILILLFMFILYTFVKENQKLLDDSFSIRFEREKLVEELKNKHVELVLAMSQTKEAKEQADHAREQAEQACEQAVHACEQAETAREQAEQAGLAKARVLAAASHDLRQPLHALSLYSAVLSQQPDPHNLPEVAQHIDLSVRALSALLNALLDISKLDAGVYQIEESSFPADTTLARIVHEFQPLAQKKNLMLYLDSRPAQAYSDPVVFEQIARNLIDNAIKYTDAGAVLVKLNPESDRIHIAVRDTGKGIPESEQNHIFEEFYQVNNPGRNRELGLGLGLSIVIRLAELIGSKIEFTSVVNEGSCFSWHIPLERRLTSGANTTIQEEGVEIMDTNYKPRQILVIEDELAIRFGMTLLLQTWGMQAHGAASQLEAQQVLEQHAIDLVIADLRLLDGENGLLVVNALRQTWKDLPVLLISGETDPRKLRDVAASGFPLMNKPIQPETLRSTILQILEKSYPGN